jgi:hypothetical protein
MRVPTELYCVAELALVKVILGSKDVAVWKFKLKVVAPLPSTTTSKSPTLPVALTCEAVPGYVFA